uniref:Transmembrane protein TMEM132 cohesin-like domain-containing protein n=1 Tax=Knipowitschia caucasica TaxID=637954 RepID=A0AAV2MN36_KNICA
MWGCPSIFKTLRMTNLIKNHRVPCGVIHPSLKPSEWYFPKSLLDSVYSPRCSLLPSPCLLPQSVPWGLDPCRADPFSKSVLSTAMVLREIKEISRKFEKRESVVFWCQLHQRWFLLLVSVERVWFQSGINFLAVKPSNLVPWEIKQEMTPGSSSLAVICQRKASSTAEREKSNLQKNV